MEITFNNHFGTIKLEEKLRSIFDNEVTGQIDINGDYYCIYADHKTKQLYALTRETGLALFTIGYPLEEGETATFNGTLRHFYNGHRKPRMSKNRATMLTHEAATEIIKTHPHHNLFIQAEYECHFREIDSEGHILI